MPCYQFGPFVLDSAKRRLLRDGEVVRLTPKAFETLLALVEVRGKTIGKDELLKRVWGDTVVEENNLNQSITALRKALGDSRSESQYIATLPGQGYRFVADVREVGAEVREEAPAGTIAPPMIGAISDSPVRRQFLIGLAVVVLVLAVVGVVSWTRRPAPERFNISSVMVLPLENLSGDPSQEYFADGMTDALIGDLARINGLRVISRTSSMHYKGKSKPLPEIASELKVDGVVEGTVLRSGDRVLVRAQLIHAASDTHLWVQTYERDVKDVLTMQSEIAQAIAREVQAKAFSDQPRAQKAVRPKAFDDYLQGRYLYWNKRTEENLQKAIEHFQNAIREDPGYALPHAGLADCYNSMGTVQVGAVPPINARKQAEEAATKALALDSGLAEAHTSLAFVHHFNWNWDAAEQSLKRALELNPNYANAHNLYASHLMAKGLIDEGLAASNRARELDPFSLSISVQRGFLLENARRYDEAIEQLRNVIAMDPNHYQAYWVLGHTYGASGRFAEAVAAAEKAVALSDRVPGALGILGLVYGLAGRKDDATKVLNELLELNKKRYVTPAALVNVYLGLGDKEQTFFWLEKAFEERSYYITYLNVFPIVDPLRSDPRFDRLLQRVGLRKLQFRTEQVSALVLPVEQINMASHAKLLNQV
jgi:TolB-like protein/DNA-binding winged helix-turn-helix (wHTH) protein/Tfp pilus assembly protein PilF